jgi:predicted flavoprotein YhiN
MATDRIGAIYQLTRELRVGPEIEIDFKPDCTLEDLRNRVSSGSFAKKKIFKSLKLSSAAAALIQEVARSTGARDWLLAVKGCRAGLDRPRPISGAISTAGGATWDQLSEDLMLHRFPGVFCAGEMIDWEAPTGGYLLQGCFVTGTIAGTGVAKWIAKVRQA